MIKKAYKYRIYPNKEQQELLEKYFGCARWFFNWGLAKKIEAYQTEKKTLSGFDLMGELVRCDRNWVCKKCKTRHNRDELAFKNIKNFALIRSGRPELTLVESSRKKVSEKQESLVLIIYRECHSLALIVEVTEFLNEINWKPWKKKQKRWE